MTVATSTCTVCNGDGVSRNPHAKWWWVAKLRVCPCQVDLCVQTFVMVRLFEHLEQGGSLPNGLTDQVWASEQYRRHQGVILYPSDFPLFSAAMVRFELFCCDVVCIVEWIESIGIDNAVELICSRS